MQMLNKRDQIATLQGKDKFERQNAIQDMLVTYRSTPPHPATGVTPYEAMRGATVRTKLGHFKPKTQIDGKDRNINCSEMSSTKKKNESEKRRKNTKETKLLLRDYVLVEQAKKNKWSTTYEPMLYIVSGTQISQVTARRTTDGRIACRDASQFNLVNNVINTADNFQKTPAQTSDTSTAHTDFRDELVRNVTLPNETLLDPLGEATTIEPTREATEPADLSKETQITLAAEPNQTLVNPDPFPCYLFCL